MSSAQPQGSMTINGGGEYSFLLCMKVYEKIYEGNLDIILNSSLGKNKRVERFCENNSIKVLKYSTMNDFSEIIKDGNYDTLVLPICYPHYADLEINDSVKIISVIHDLCEVYYGILNVKYGRYPKQDHMNWYRKLRNKIKYLYDTKLKIEMHNRVITLNNNQHVITVTYYSKSTMQHYLEIAADTDISVFYTPERYVEKCDFKNEKYILDKYGIKKKRYFLMSAGCRWAKNNTIAMFVLDKMMSNDKYKQFFQEYKVVLIGLDDDYMSFYKKHLINIERFSFDKYVDDETLETLYKNAHLFIFPSIIEGFGLPPVEAMKYGTVSACSTAMSIPEVCGAAAIYFDPYSEESIEMAILRSFDKDYMNDMSDEALKRIETLSVRRKADLKKIVDIILQ